MSVPSIPLTYRKTAKPAGERATEDQACRQENQVLRSAEDQANSAAGAENQ